MNALKNRGHSCGLTIPSYWIIQPGVRDLVARIPALQDVDIQISPDGWSGDVAEAKEFATYAELLHAWSFGNSNTLFRQVQMWQTIFADFQPDAVLSHHAPSALLAAQLLGLPVGQFGDGFVVPRVDNPMPCFAPWRSSPDDILHSQSDAKNLEAQVLCNMREVIKQFVGVQQFIAAAPTSLAAWLSSVPDYLCTLPVLDHYGERPGAFYYGVHENPVQGIAGQWPDTQRPNSPAHTSPKVLVYLSSKHPSTLPVVQALSSLGWPTIIHQQGENFSAPNIRHYAEPIDLQKALSEAEIFVCHAPHLSCAQAIACGIPVLLLPSNVEQEMVAVQMTRLGVGMVPEKTNAAGLEQALSNLYSNLQLRQRAASLSITFQQFDAHAAAAELAEDFCLDLGLSL